MKRKVILAVMTVVAVSIVSAMTIKLNVKEEKPEVRVVEIPIQEVEEEIIPEPKREKVKVYHTYINWEYIWYVEEISEMYNVCPELIFAIIEQESSGNPNAENAGCYGLMQVSERWHKDRMERLGVTDLFDPYGNILVGVDYLMELADTYGDLDMILMVYNGSSDAQERWENGNPTEYVTDIVNRSVELERLHGR